MVHNRNFEEEYKQAQQIAERLTHMLQAHGYEVGTIDWQSSGRLAYVPVNEVEVGDLLTLNGSSERGRLLEDIRYKLLEAAAQQQLHTQESAVSWTPLDAPSGASELHSLWRIHVGEKEQSGVNIAEMVRDGKRSYEYYPAGPTPGVHTFYVDKITARALQLIREAGGTVSYQPEAQRTDDEWGRRQVKLPEGSHQESEGDEQMASQRFTLPGGAELRLVPQWHTIELCAADERVKEEEAQ